MVKCVLSAWREISLTVRRGRPTTWDCSPNPTHLFRLAYNMSIIIVSPSKGVMHCSLAPSQQLTASSELVPYMHSSVRSRRYFESTNSRELHPSGTSMDCIALRCRPFLFVQLVRWGTMASAFCLSPVNSIVPLVRMPHESLCRDLSAGVKYSTSI